MKIVIVSDAWSPQVNGVVTTLVDLRSRLVRLGHEVVLVEPSLFRRVRCPGYGEVELAWNPGPRIADLIESSRPDAIHLATEGPLGWAARRHCRRHGLAFTTAFHSRWTSWHLPAVSLPGLGYSAAAPLPCAFGRGDGAVARNAGDARARLRQPASVVAGIDLDLFRPRRGANSTGRVGPVRRPDLA
jgi:glycosyltransferase involved in cell wall biosynthesis